MFALFYFFFAAAVFVSFYISILDLKTGFIPNKLLALLLGLGIVYNAGFVQNPMGAITVFFYALCISVFLWVIGIWPAGDAKMFSVLFLLLPVELYSANGLVFSFLVNIFVPIFLLMLLVIAVKSRFKILVESLKFSLEPYNVLMLSTILFGFVWFVMRGIHFLSAGLSVQLDYFLTIALMFFAFGALGRFLSEKIEFLFIGLGVLRVLLDYSSIYSLSFAWKFFSTLFVFIFFRFFILFIAFKIYTYRVPIKGLKPGMSPAETIVEREGGFARVSSLNTSLISFMSNRLEKAIHNREFLTEKDIEKIKKLRQDKKIPFSTLLINRVQPFAVFILAGYILTVILKTDFITAIIG